MTNNTIHRGRCAMRRSCEAPASIVHRSLNSMDSRTEGVFANEFRSTFDLTLAWRNFGVFVRGFNR
jgi:hypothetical protein